MGIGRTFFRGLSWILPIGVTVYVVLWVFNGVERVVKDLLDYLLPHEVYFPGLGFLVCILLIYVTGLITKTSLVRKLFGLIESFIQRIPIIKTIYGPLRDLMKYLDGSEGKKLGEPVAVKLDLNDDSYLLGFLTKKDLRIGFDNQPGIVEGMSLVYFPMSYQIGGYSLMIPNKQIIPLRMNFEETMKFILTGGMSDSDLAVGKIVN